MSNSTLPERSCRKTMGSIQSPHKRQAVKDDSGSYHYDMIINHGGIPGQEVPSSNSLRGFTPYNHIVTKQDVDYHALHHHATDTNALVSPRLLSDSSQATALSYTYFPYGESTETVTDSDASANRYRFTGREYETGYMNFYRSRYYNNRMGRFFSKDIWKGNFRRPLSFNKYLYVIGNPIKLNDPSGHCFSSSTFNSDLLNNPNNYSLGGPGGGEDQMHGVPCGTSCNCYHDYYDSYGGSGTIIDGDSEIHTRWCQMNLQMWAEFHVIFAIFPLGGEVTWTYEIRYHYLEDFTQSCGETGQSCWTYYVAKVAEVTVRDAKCMFHQEAPYSVGDRYFPWYGGSPSISRSGHCWFEGGSGSQ